MDINIDMDKTLSLEADSKADAMDFSKLNDELRDFIERNEQQVKMPRNVHSALNHAIAAALKKYVRENSLEEGCCYFVKNVTPSTNVCFVHRFSAEGKTFQNLEFSKMPVDVKRGDVIILKDGKYMIEPELTNVVLSLRRRALETLKNSIELFRVEGKEYLVCDKSDDAVRPKMSLRIDETNQEFWGIDISQELHSKIKYGSKVLFKDGEYISLEE